MIKSVLILDEFFAITAKIRTLFLSHIKITNYLTLKHGTFNLRRYTYFSHLLNNGIVDITMSKYEVITAILQKYGVTDIWDVVPENQKI